MNIYLVTRYNFFKATELYILLLCRMRLQILHTVLMFIPSVTFITNLTVFKGFPDRPPTDRKAGTPLFEVDFLLIIGASVLQ